ncbi:MULTISPECIES: Bug family tripartite tricarboxylate transporter substrate binding protein [Neorhizobium]|uniref:Bug family tripartite tricarboxylate transporter substrate binding protein n=1 Tax=Neorhizobium TaxID=1525371 RepID=UPI00155E1873|nr:MULTISPECIES: tripartite tricarboxylate transporter substrate binding protein [Neorhizobium]
MITRRHMLVSAAAGALAPRLGFAQQAYPSRPVTIIVPVAPGGLADIITRAAAERLSVRSKQSFIVDYVVGVGGSKGNQDVANAVPDGYTLALTTEALLLVNPHLYKNVRYRAEDFEPVGILAELPLLLLVPKNHPAKNLADFVSMAKAKPGSMSYGSSGAGTMPHLVGHQFAKAAGISLVHIPYKSGAGSLTDLIAGRLDLLAAGVPLVAGSIGPDGPLRPIAVAGPERIASLPDVPTVAEASVAGFNLRSPWWGLVAPRGTPRDIIDRLNGWLALDAMTEDEKQKLISTKLEPKFIGSAEMGDVIRSEAPVWKAVIEEMGLSL